MLINFVKVTYARKDKSKPCLLGAISSSILSHSPYSLSFVNSSLAPPSSKVSILLFSANKSYKLSLIKP